VRGIPRKENLRELRDATGSPIRITEQTEEGQGHSTAKAKTQDRATAVPESQ